MKEGMIDRPAVLVDPSPRTLGLMFRKEDEAELRRIARLLPEGRENPGESDIDRILPEVEYVLGQTGLPKARLDQAPKLKAVFNVEGNFMPNIDYKECFRRGIRVLNVSPVFAQSVAELGLGLALDLARGITENHVGFQAGSESYGLESNGRSRLLYGSKIGILGYGALGRALHHLFMPFKAEVLAHDPWLPDSLLEEAGCRPVGFDEIFMQSDTLFVTASVTTENIHAINGEQLSVMPDGASLILLSRAAVADFSALSSAARSGRIRIATDVFPEEPVRPDDPIRSSGILLSAHRAGALDWAFKEMGRYVLTDLKQMNRGLPPVKCVVAQPETVGRLRSKPVDKS